MNRFAHFTLSIGLIYLFSACGTVGKRFDSSQVKNIREGVTTKSQILEIFGLPYKEGVQDGKTTWTYQHHNFSAVGPGEYKDLVILFDKTGTIKSYRYTTTSPKKFSR